MTNMRRRALNWLLAGTAFLMVVMSTGCAQESSHAVPRSAPIPAQFAGNIGSVNRFGEIVGMPCETTARPVGASALQQHTFLDDGYDGDVAVSPDGTWLLFSSTRHSEAPEIYI